VTPVSGWYETIMVSAKTANIETTPSTATLTISNGLSPNKTVTITQNFTPPTYLEYLFEESGGTTVFDSNYSNDGTIINSASRVDGVRGNGLEFTGTSYISLGLSFGENVQNEVTLSAWIRPASTGSYQGIIMHGGPATDTYSLYVRPDAREIAFKTSGTSNAFYTISSVNTLWDGDWHLLTVTYDGIKKVIYLDKDVLGEVDASGSIQ
jgi:hypothetical protein